MAIILAIVFSFSTPVAMAYISDEYTTSAELAVGTVVSTSENGEIVAASTASREYLGVIVAQDANKVEVVSSGAVNVLVSDMDGDIKIGEELGLSAVSGIASRLLPGSVTIGVVTAEPKDWHEVNAENDKVRVATATVQLIARNSASEQSNSSYLTAIQRAADGVAGREVDTWRAVTGLVVATGGIGLAFALLVSSSRGSFLSLGRNPMAGGAIMRGLWKIASVAVLIMTVSLASAYLIVRSG